MISDGNIVLTAERDTEWNIKWIWVFSGFTLLCTVQSVINIYVHENINYWTFSLIRLGCWHYRRTTNTLPTTLAIEGKNRAVYDRSLKWGYLLLNHQK